MSSQSGTIIGIRPQQFVHVLDLNSNITRVEVGPQTFALQTQERLQCGPLPYVVVPPGHYCKIQNPRKKTTNAKTCKCRVGYFKMIYHGEPFYLYPDEILVGAEGFAKGGNDDYSKAIVPLPVIKPNHAIRLQALMDHQDGEVLRRAGDMWQLEGPLTYYPRAEVETLENVEPYILKPGQALKLKAVQDTTDRQGIKRVTGEEWLITKEGAYLPGVFEELVELVKCHVLTKDTGVHLRAIQNVVDSLGKERKAGEEWIITGEDTEVFIPHIGVEVVASTQRTVVRKGQYCVVNNPVDRNGVCQLGSQQLRSGHCTFFLHPGESLDGGIKQAYILQADLALVLQAVREFEDEDGAHHAPGDRWMITGPRDYVPSVEVKVLETRQAIPLNKNEGVYVRNICTGQVRAVMGPQSYMLTADEVLFEKQLSSTVELLLKKGGGHGSEDIRKVAYFEQSIDPSILKGRDKTKVVTYRCPGNTACQVYNYKKKTARVLFGPELVILGPDENFNVLSLSAGKPKKPDSLKSLCLLLGPDFITDILEVETCDHARLQIKLAFNNYFKVDKSNPVEAEKIFAVPDFIGYACRQIGSKIRASVAQITFDEFHRHSAQVIRHAVFGTDKDGNQVPYLLFNANNLVVTNVDIQSIEPVDKRMRESLMKSVQMAIEISTRSIEAAASHEAERMEQAARGQLEQQKLTNEMQAEQERCQLLELKASTAAIESTGQAVAEAQASRERMLIECQSKIDAAVLRAKAEEVEHAAQLEIKNQLQEAELEFLKRQNDMDLQKNRDLSSIEVKKFEDMVIAVGKDTLSAIATAGPESQVELLKGLGLSSVLITDGNSPINLFNTAKGLIGK